MLHRRTRRRTGEGCRRQAQGPSPHTSRQRTGAWTTSRVQSKQQGGRRSATPTTTPSTGEAPTPARPRTPRPRTPRPQAWCPGGRVSAKLLLLTCLPWMRTVERIRRRLGPSSAPLPRVRRSRRRLQQEMQPRLPGGKTPWRHSFVNGIVSSPRRNRSRLSTRKGPHLRTAAAAADSLPRLRPARTTRLPPALPRRPQRLTRRPPPPPSQRRPSRRATSLRLRRRSPCPCPPHRRLRARPRRRRGAAAASGDRSRRCSRRRTARRRSPRRRRQRRQKRTRKTRRRRLRRRWWRRGAQRRRQTCSSLRPPTWRSCAAVTATTSACRLRSRTSPPAWRHSFAKWSIISPLRTAAA
eukprot:Rhum_TRINITY_DN14220_c6_g1::Rhum_TRINITY_DN14220_c6_g1_i2::g.74323::m.74323